MLGWTDTFVIPSHCTHDTCHFLVDCRLLMTPYHLLIDCKLHYTMPSLARNESRYCQVKARSPAMALDDEQSSLGGFKRNRSNASLIMKDYSEQSRVYLAVNPKQVRVPLCKLISHFTMGLNGSPCDYIIT